MLHVGLKATKGSINLNVVVHTRGVLEWGLWDAGKGPRLPSLQGGLGPMQVPCQTLQRVVKTHARFSLMAESRMNMEGGHVLHFVTRQRT